MCTVVVYIVSKRHSKNDCSKYKCPRPIYLIHSLLHRFHINNVTTEKVRLERKEMVGYDDIHSQCFKDTVSAYQKVRQNGELHIPAFMAALEAYKKHEGEADDAS